MATESSPPFNQHGGLTLVPMPGFEQLAERIQQRFSERNYGLDTPVDIAQPHIGRRASGEPFVRLEKKHIAGHDCVVLTSWPGTAEMLVELSLVLRYLCGRRASRVAVVTGYFPLGRSDKDEGSTEFALAPIVVDLLMMSTYRRLDRVIAVDLHAPQVVMSGRTGIITEVSLARRVLKQAVAEAIQIGDPVCLCFPDDTAAKRLEWAVDQTRDEMGIDLPAVYGSKRRTSSRSSTLAGLFGDVHALSGATVLNIDDEIATGGTLLGAARALREQHQVRRVWAVVTHGVLCGDAPQRFSEDDCPVERVFMTDTIPVHNRPDLHPLMKGGVLDITPWWPDLSWVLYHHHWNLSIRELR